MPAKWIGICLICISGIAATRPAIASEAPFLPLAERTAQLVNTLRDAKPVSDRRRSQAAVASASITIEHCDGYPYAATRATDLAARTLLDDLADGLQTGLRCLSGLGPMGRLHQFHEYQAHRLLKLFESDADKTFRCVDDAMFATAVATSPDPLQRDDPLYAQLRDVTHPAVILDTFRLGGLLSRRHDDETFRNFFHLGDEQIFEHRYGQPLRAANLHRYEDRAALLFHEVVHWLGHQHSAIYPDLTHLYETCCFGGSDYIDNDVINSGHQQTACNILKDDSLWAQGHHPYKQMRIWHYKGYDRFKTDMRSDYAR